MHVALEAGEPIAGRAALDRGWPQRSLRRREHARDLPGARGRDGARLRGRDPRRRFRFLYERAKLACEPAGAVPTAALLAGKIELDAAGTTVAVVSGGNVAAQTAVAILAEE